jgi:hypothetical protein
MIRSTVLFILAIVTSIGYLHAQAPCAFDKKHSELLQQNPIYAEQIEQNNALIQKLVAERKAKKPGDPQTLAVVTIPVVVHVMHTGGPVGSLYNPDDTQILGAIDYLNKVYAGTLAGMTAPIEGGGVVNMEIQFALAQRTPSCGSTNGINRVDASSLPNYTARGVNADSANGTPELTVKNLARWNPANYYNIWIVNKIDSKDGTAGQFIAGYAYFPGASSSLDGTIMLATQMRANEKTLPHEIGHALNLYHTFNGSTNLSQCAANTNCNLQGDQVCDTDPIAYNYNTGTGVFSFACRSGANPCAGNVPYTINTESNFMSYTNCYTLFTNGQKARVQASLSLSSRASLVDPSNLALVPCGTIINFSVPSATLTEGVSGITDGCRTYTDYTYQMTIGNAPSQAATATLSFGGTAVRGLDYEVTTNENFNSPDFDLHFAAGSTSAQSFKVRIYDDGAVESSESVIIDFAVNSGGGDASAGTTTPTLTLTIADNDSAPVGASTGTVSIGSLSTPLDKAPFNAMLQQQRSQYLYKASELVAAGIAPGNITALQFFVTTKRSTRPFSNFTVRMANTTLNYLREGSSVTVVGGMTTVYTSTSYTTTAGWNVFTLPVPFTWTGNSIAIEICFTNAGPDNTASFDDLGGYSDGGTAIQSNVFYQNDINCATGFSSVTVLTYGYKPIIRLGTEVIGTPIETAGGSLSANHLQSGSNDYLYSNNNKLMLGLSNLSADLGCVSTSLEQAGTSWIPYQGGQRSAKVFAVTPSTNAASVSYTASFYFTTAELDGKNPATLRLAKTSAATIAAADYTNTIMVTPSVANLGSDGVVFTASFTGFSKFFLVDGAVTLPVTLMDFGVKLNGEGDGVVSWSTSLELNNAGFEVETSRDGITFTTLGTVASHGDGQVNQYYSYLHEKPQAGIHYYRLKQTDFDGKISYSKIISLLVDNMHSKATIYPVPANDRVTIHFGGMIRMTTLEMFSAEMRLVKRERIGGPVLTKEIVVNDLPSGIYFIRYKRGENTEVLRFIKK